MCNHHHKKGTLQFQQKKAPWYYSLRHKPPLHAVFQHYSFAFSSMSNKRNHAAHNLLTLSCLTLHVFEFHSSCSIIPFYCWVLFHWWVYHHLFIHPLEDIWAVSRFALTTWNYEHPHTGFWVNKSFHFTKVDRYPGVGLRGHIISIHITPQETAKWFFRVGYHFAFPRPSHENSRCQHLVVSVFSVSAILICV